MAMQHVPWHVYSNIEIGFDMNHAFCGKYKVMKTMVIMLMRTRAR